MAAIEKMLTYSDFNENWYYGVIWFQEHNGTIKAMFWVAFFFAGSAYHAILLFVSQVSDSGSWEPLVFFNSFYKIF